MSGTVRIEREGPVAVLVIDNPPVNASTQAIRQGLLDAVGALEADASVAAVVLIGAGRSFIAGSDLREFDLPLGAPQLPAVIGAIEQSGKPYVAALHGAALGGGYELALGCDARIAAPGTRLGLPETTLGIIPGAGGTQKLPRLVGTARAIELICSGRRVDADEAQQIGMVDEVAEGDLRAAAVALAGRLAGTKRRVIDRAVPPDPAEDVEATERKALRGASQRPAIVAAIAHVKAAATTPAGDGLAAERATFERLRLEPEARALRYIFFAEREAARGAPAAKAEPRRIATVGVVGAGTMGAGIATALLQSGYRAVMVDTSADALARGVARLDGFLDRAVATGRSTAEGMQAARAKLSTGTTLADLSGCDLVIEAVIEDLGAKRDVFAELDGIVGPDAILATNTSYLDIDASAGATRRPERVIGLHFFSPAHVMKLVEVIGGAQSSPEALATGMALAKSLGKQPVAAGNGFGFIGNRIYSAYRASCEFMLEDGALPHEVDAAIEAFGFAMGPFAVADLSGLDIAWRMRQQRAATRDPAERYVDIPDRLCALGRFGRKTEGGYYDYSDSGQRQRSASVEALVIEESARKGKERRVLTPAAIQQQAMAAIVNEAALVLEDGIAFRPGDIDVVLVNGYGFPRWRGGPLWWARQQDPAALEAACAAFAADAGRRRADLAALGLLAGSPAPEGETT